jgi:hypothetical protein
LFSQIKKASVDTSLKPKPVTVKWTKIIEQFVTNLNNICLNEITEKISDLKHNLTESNSSTEIPAKLDNLVHDFSDLLKNAVIGTKGPNIQVRKKRNKNQINHGMTMNAK